MSRCRAVLLGLLVRSSVSWAHAPGAAAWRWPDRGGERVAERVARVTLPGGGAGWSLRVRDARGRESHPHVGRSAVLTLRAGCDPAGLFARLGVRDGVSLMPAIGAWRVRSADAREDGLDLAARLGSRAEPCLRGATPDLYLARVASQFPLPPDDPRYGGQWYLARISIERAWRRVVGDPAVTVSVVDNGCDLGHPDLAESFLPGRDVLDGDDDPSLLPGERGNEHGTACAGVIAARGNNREGIAGVCPRCTLRCIRLLAPRGERVPVSADVAAFDWSLAQGVAVVSNSWGFAEPTPVPAPLAEALQAVATEGRGGLGAVVVFAAGNDHREITAEELYGVPGVVTVGAVNNFDEVTTFSNRGAVLTLSAPTGTVTTDPRGVEGNDPGDYSALFGGTSSAAPVVAGVAALLIAARPSLTAREVVDAMVRSARPAPFATPDANGHDPVYGVGIVDPAGALDLVLGPEPVDAGAPEVPMPDAAAAIVRTPTTQGCSCTTMRPTPAPRTVTALLAAMILVTVRRRGARIALLTLLALGCRRATPRVDAAPPEARIVSVGGAVTETVFALGDGARVVGTDSSSTHPPEATRRPQVGYLRALSAEGVLALRPTLLLTTTDAGPPPVLRQLREAGVRVEMIPAQHGAEGARARVRAIAALLHREREGAALEARMDLALQALPAPREPRPRVLFIYARGAGAANVAGRETAADAIISLAGGMNAVQGYANYRPLTPEALVAAAPDAILLTTRGLQSLGGRAAVLAMPGVGATPAGRTGRVIDVDDLLLLGFGPRVGEAAAALSAGLRRER
jgi:serine protease